MQLPQLVDACVVAIGIEPVTMDIQCFHFGFRSISAKHSRLPFSCAVHAALFMQGSK